MRRFPRYHKVTQGSELRQTAQRIYRLVSRVNEARDTGRVDDLAGAVEEMQTLLTLAQEIKAFAHFNDFAAATELTVSLGKQGGGWRRRVRPEAPAHSSALASPICWSPRPAISAPASSAAPWY